MYFRRVAFCFASNHLLVMILYIPKDVISSTDGTGENFGLEVGSRQTVLLESLLSTYFARDELTYSLIAIMVSRECQPNGTHFGSGTAQAVR
ncbi:MAG: hypothetical protein FJ267_05325 [Planctomycetes bacterium]|nr:hypothetical protein [Planctomycetota bacterium]